MLKLTHKPPKWRNCEYPGCTRSTETKTRAQWTAAKYCPEHARKMTKEAIEWTKSHEK